MRTWFDISAASRRRAVVSQLGRTLRRMPFYQRSIQAALAINHIASRTILRQRLALYACSAAFRSTFSDSTALDGFRRGAVVPRLSRHLVIL